jgi:hypothetical protein
LKAPIVTFEGADLIVFDSIEAATSFVEPQFVSKPSSTTFDSEGRRLVFELEGPGREWQKRVVLREQESEPTHQAELRAVLVAALRATGEEPDPSASLGSLLEAALARFRAPGVTASVTTRVRSLWRRLVSKRKAPR